MSEYREMAVAIEDMFCEALNTFDDNRARTQQSKRGGLGPSSLGHCRNHAVLTLLGTRPDERVVPDSGLEVWNLPAQVGSAWHDWVDKAVTHLDLLTGAQIGPVTATFPQSGATISGIPDWYDPVRNVLLDGKTKNRIAYAQRQGPDQNNRFQRHTYAMGLVDAGIARDDGTLMVGNVFFDRSGTDKRPYVQVEPFDPNLTAEIDMWIEDVLYAYRHREQASQDKPYDFCQRFCGFFMSCRGGIMEDSHEPTLIQDEEALTAVGMYAEGAALEREGKKLKDAAKPVLQQVNGRAELPNGESWQVRQTHVQATMYKRDAYDRLDVRRIKR